MCRADSLQPEANGISGRLRRNPARADRYSPVSFHNADSAADQDAASNGDSDRPRSIDKDLPQASIKVALPLAACPGNPPKQTMRARSLMKETGSILNHCRNIHKEKASVCRQRDGDDVGTPGTLEA